MITTLIDKQDNFEIIRDQIAAILALEVAAQMALATAAAKDPEDWNLKVYAERSNSWESWLNQSTTRTPKVNVWFDGSTFDDSGSNTMERQKTEATFNIDCYGFGLSSDNLAGGHNPGDRDAAYEVQRAIRLVRNILMAAEYTYLGLRGTVWSRRFQSVTAFQPPLGENSVQQITGARLAFRVIFNEFSPQVEAQTLELVSTQVKRAEDGAVVIAADYGYPLP